jgi:transforming growth factor-beta-induced protein
MAADLNIIDTAIQRGTFTVFSGLLEGSLLEKRLRSESSFTLFAPADIAFTRLSAITLHWLLEPQNEQRLVEILRYHIVHGRLSCKQLEQIKSARTEQGQELKIDLRQTILIDSARIILRDIDATNGVIHGIDSLLMPCTVAAVAM